VKAVQWKQTMGYTFAYPIPSPEGERYGMAPVREGFQGQSLGPAAQSHRTPATVQMDRNGKLLLSIGDDVINHTMPRPTHRGRCPGQSLDHRRVGATAKKISPDGKVLMTIGVRGHRGDWIESRANGILWEPLMVGFNARGDIYIAQGTAMRVPTTPIQRSPPTIAAPRASASR
jgi:hypothetical protein